MKFYGILTGPQIAGLFEAGCLDRYTPTEPPLRGQWRTVNEQVPLQKYETSALVGHHRRSASSQLRVRLPAAIVLCLVSAVAIAVVGYLFFGTRPSADRQVASRIVAPAASRSATSASSQVKSSIAQSSASDRTRVDAFDPAHRGLTTPGL